jgi:hypothetical protein
MGMNIKTPEVHAMARELATRTSQELQDALYDEHGRGAAVAESEGRGGAL